MAGRRVEAPDSGDGRVRAGWRGACAGLWRRLARLWLRRCEGLDLTDADAIRRVMREVRPRWVVNAAAHTAVDKAESEPELAFAINATAPGDSGRRGEEDWRGRDSLFDRLCFRRLEDDSLCRDRCRQAAERVRQEQAGAANWLWVKAARHTLPFGRAGFMGRRETTLFGPCLRLAQERDHLKIVGGPARRPTWSFELARMTADVIGQMEATGGEEEQCSLDGGGAAAEWRLSRDRFGRDDVVRICGAGH